MFVHSNKLMCILLLLLCVLDCRWKTWRHAWSIHVSYAWVLCM